jgi:hypothetical protein
VKKKTSSELVSNHLSSGLPFFSLISWKGSSVRRAEGIIGALTFWVLCSYYSVSAYVDSEKWCVGAICRDGM